MVKIVVAKLRPRRSKRDCAFVLKRMCNPDGGVSEPFVLDAKTSTFADGLTHTFVRNVAKARRDNKTMLGLPKGLRKAAKKASRSSRPDH